MTSPKNLTIAVLAAAALAISTLAYLQYDELVGLRARVADGDATALKRDLANAKRTIKSLQDRLSAMRSGRREGDGNGEEGGPGGEGGRPPAWRGGRFGAFGALSGNPEFQKLLAIQAKGRLSQVYGPLFKSLNLTPEQLDQFQGLLAEKQQALMDVMQAAREQGISPRDDPDGFKALVNQAVSQTDQAIQQALGDAGFQQYQQYQQTLPDRNTANSVAQALSYTQTPLTDDQENQLISLLQQTQPQRAGNGTETTSAGGTGGPGLMALINGGGNARVTDETIAQASTILTAPQVAALQQVQAQQQAQQQMQQLMRQASQGNTAPPATSTPASGGKG